MRALLTNSIAMCLATVMSSNVLAADSLKADLENCKITFVGSKPDGAKHEGGFKKFVVDAQADFEDPSKSSLRIEINSDSLWSDDEKLTSHLKNADFFDVRKYPKIVFESTKVDAHDDTSTTIVGKMKMLDKTEELKVPVTVEVSDSSVKITAKFKLDRTKWGMNYGEGKINKEVDLVAELVFKR